MHIYIQTSYTYIDTGAQIHILIYTYKFTYTIYTSINSCIYVYNTNILTYVCRFIYMQVFTSILHTYAHIYKFTCISAYTHIYAKIYTHIYIHTHICIIHSCISGINIVNEKCCYIAYSKMCFNKNVIL